MITRLVLASLCGLCFTPAAMADKFHCGSAETAKQMTDGSADIIEGVLLEEKDGFYVIRIEGGEIRMAKSSVYKVEKDGLTVAQIEQSEKAAATTLAEANMNRNQVQAADAAARRESMRAVQAADAAMSTDEAAVVEGPVPASYDPIIRRVVPNSGSVINGYLQKELGGYIRRDMQRKLRQVRKHLRQAYRRS